MKSLASRFPVYSITSPDRWPDLWKVERPPKELFIQGKPEALWLLKKLPERGLAVVGSRQCQERSRSTIRSVLAGLSGFDLVIISGLARGIDAQAHLCALEMGFPTIAVLGCGLRHSYPPENHELRVRILEAGGLVISEFSPEEEPKAYHFIQRNRLIAGWTKATWVVEAGFKSGAINTASWAKKQEHPCFVTPCYPGDPTLAGNQRLLETERLKEGWIQPLWNERSFAQVWLELESFFALRRSRVLAFQKPEQLSFPNPSSEMNLFSLSQEIRGEVRQQTTMRGGIRVPDLMEWSIEKGHSSEQFFLALRAALDRKWVIMRSGILTSDSNTE